MFKTSVFFAVWMACSSLLTAQEFSTPIKVELQQKDGRWQLFRDGQPYRIHGAGGPGSLKLLAECGANSHRKWGADEEIRDQLDEAHRNGLSVALGIWLEHKGPQFDYSNFENVAAQVDKVMASVRRFKNHPAVLVWGIGNEMEGANGDDPSVWSHVEHLARLVKAEDPNHPTMSVIAEMGGRKIEAIHKLCPSLDIIGINSYGGALSLSDRYRKLGGSKPYIVTEFGPVGTWEVEKNQFGAIEEPTSTEKADVYRNVYEKIDADQELCLGSYAFLWGQKQEGTATWFGLLLPDGNKTGPVDVLTEKWSGKPPVNRCPVIDRLSIQGEAIVKSGTSLVLNCEASDPENDPLNFRWKLMAEADAYVTGGFFQKTPTEFSDRFSPSDQASTTVSLPQEAGLYRIYVTVDDGRQASAVANVVVKVASDKTTAVDTDSLPFVVFDETDNSDSFSPSGWMGNTSALKLELQCKTNPFAGQVCLQCDYNLSDDWAGVVWQCPANDWGDQDGGFDLSIANKLTFRAKGNAGGEKVTFGVGVIGPEKPFSDSVRKEMMLTLGTEWEAYSIDLSASDRSRIKSGFWFSVAGQDRPVQFFLDQIRFEGD